jgi:hypothetical protein
MGRVASRARNVWLVPTTILLLVLGHACELPSIVSAVAAAEADGHAHDHHGAGGTGSSDTSEVVSCDSVAAVPKVSRPALTLDGHTVIAPPPIPYAGAYARLHTAAVAPDPPPPRRPLFLLLATLLI